jgi:hypothetical protein
MTSKDGKRQAAKVLYDLKMGLWEANMSKLSYDEDQDNNFRISAFYSGTEVTLCL